MRSYELKPTHENLISVFLKDPIGRNSDVLSFAELLNTVEGNCSISLDGSWGSGKTFFVKQVKMFLDANNATLCPFNEEDQYSIISAWTQHHRGAEPNFKPQVTIYYDAWENDNDTDPILSLVYSIVREFGEQVSLDLETKASFFQAASALLEIFTGKNWTSIAESLRSEDPLDGIRKHKDIEKKIKEFLDSLLSERGERLVIFVDELDRCKPSYAVQLLERIKHYFTNDRITFVFSINSNELQHTIKRYYGNEFDASRYLDRFFDLPVTIPPENKDAFYRNLGFNNTSYIYDIMCGAVIEEYHLTLREITRYIKLAKIAAYNPTHEGAYDFAFHEEVRFCLVYVVPIMLGLKLTNLPAYNRFVQGIDGNPLLKFSPYLREAFFEKLLNRTETYDSSETGKTLVTLESKLNDVYNALFVQQFTRLSEEYVVIGQYRFNQATRDRLHRTVSLFSSYTDYSID